jgi:hypothetical protein
MAQLGRSDIDSDKFFIKRGEVLDRLDGGDVWEWLQEMRKYGRCRFPQFEVEDDAEEETGQRESAPDPAEEAV